MSAASSQSFDGLRIDPERGRMGQPFGKPRVPHRTWVEVDADALKDNIGILQNVLEPGVASMAVVKANAYGHGLVDAAKVAEEAGVHWIGVDSLPEAKTLLDAEIGPPILIMGYTQEEYLAEVVASGVRQVVYDPRTIVRLGEETKSQGKEARIHMKIETGTSRQGVLPEDLPGVLPLIQHYPDLILEGVYTHFANIEDTDDSSYAELQLKRFHEALGILTHEGYTALIRHSAASAAALLYPETHFDLVRLGITMYGLWPSQEVKRALQAQGKDLALKPVLSFKTRIAQIKNLPAGTPVGYGLTEYVTRDSRVAVLPVGYWDGYDRGLSRTGEVLIRGKRAKVIGRVCMNMMMVDATDIPGAKVEDEVVLIGKQGDEEVSADEIAQKIDTINYEVVTRINPLLPRVFL